MSLVPPKEKTLCSAVVDRKTKKVKSVTLSKESRNRRIVSRGVNLCLHFNIYIQRTLDEITLHMPLPTHFQATSSVLHSPISAPLSTFSYPSKHVVEAEMSRDLLVSYPHSLEDGAVMSLSLPRFFIFSMHELPKQAHANKGS